MLFPVRKLLLATHTRGKVAEKPLTPKAMPGSPCPSSPLFKARAHLPWVTAPVALNIGEAG